MSRLLASVFALLTGAFFFFFFIWPMASEPPASVENPRKASE